MCWDVYFKRLNSSLLMTITSVVIIKSGCSGLQKLKPIACSLNFSFIENRFPFN